MYAVLLAICVSPSWAYEAACNHMVRVVDCDEVGNTVCDTDGLGILGDSELGGSFYLIGAGWQLFLLCFLIEFIIPAGKHAW